MRQKSITQRELRNNSGRIMRELDKGKRFVITRNGVPVAELTPVRRRMFVSREEVMASRAGFARVDFRRFRQDVDAVIDQRPFPRA